MQSPTTPRGEQVVTGADVQMHSVRVDGALLPRLQKRVLILGNGQLAFQLCAAIRDKRLARMVVVGYVDRELNRASQWLGSDLFLGSIAQLLEVVEQHRVHMIAVCLEDRRAALPVQMLLDFKAMGMEVVDGHHLFEQAAGRLSIDSLRPSALVFSTGFKRRAITTLTKRAFDFIFAAVSLVLLSPLFLLVGILVKLDSAGPMFYSQMRVGLRGHPYLIWKFRSMVQDAEKSGPRWAQNNDPRVSRVGWWLRKTRLDELPQFINVLKGEMSLVGPRPERPVFVQELRAQIPYYDIRHTVRPGITGWAQTQFRYGASAEDSHAKLQYDLYYVKNVTFALDARILVETIRVVLLGEGAR